MAGIGAFVKHTKESGSGGGQWLDWKDKGRIAVWLHTNVPPVPRYSHQFIMLDVGEDKDSGKPKQFLRFPRFNSPDPEIVHRNQRFRDKQTDSMKVPPDRDPFLLLREWLRRAEHIGLEDPIFRWTDPKDNDVITWTRGELSGRVKRSQKTFAHNLDTREEYVMVVVDHEAPGNGAVLTAESGLLGRRLGEVIAQQIHLLGDEAGDPLITPYGFIWENVKNARSPMDKYKVYKADGYEVTDEIWELITSGEYPQPGEFCEPRDGDLEKVRAAMEAAAQQDLPIEDIFSEDSAVRLALATGQRARPAKSSAPAATRQAPAQRPAPAAVAPARSVQRPAAAAPARAVATQQRRTVGAPAAAPAAAPALAKQPAARQVARSSPRSTAAAPTPAAAAPEKAQLRRRKAEAAPPPEPTPEPEVEEIACDGCGAAMPVTATKCPACGAEYELLDGEVPEEESAAASVEEEECFACRAPVVNGVCTNEHCGIEASDDIPF